MAKKNWLSQLQKFDNAVVGNYDRFAHVIETPSPSVNFSFGRGMGLPLGYTAVLYGPPKGGKSVLCNATVGHMHKADPEAFAIKFDTEMREEGQLTDKDAAMWGIDRARYQTYSGNTPANIFDRISNEIRAMCQDGFPLKLIIIDSLNGIRGRRTLAKDNVDQMQIGDKALTIQVGLEQILETQRKYNIAMILTTHVGAEMDKTEQMRGNKVRMAAGYGTKHHAEYFIYIEPNMTTEARKTLQGEAFYDEKKGAHKIVGGADRSAHKIRTCMKANSMGPAGRMGEFTLDYNAGVINVHEEVFLLCVNRGIIEKPNARTYVFDGKEWTSKDAMIEAIRDYDDLKNNLLIALKKADAEGKFAHMDVTNTEAPEMETLEGEEE